MEAKWKAMRRRQDRHIQKESVLKGRRGEREGGRGVQRRFRSSQGARGYVDDGELRPVPSSLAPPSRVTP